MIAALFSKFGLDAGLRLGGATLRWLVVAGLIAAGGLGFWRGMVAIERMMIGTRDSAIAERDAHWMSQIAASNAEAEKARADQAIAAARASAEAESKITDLTKMLHEWEAKNAAAPDAACLSPDDVDALNRLRRPDVTRPGGAHRDR